MTTARYSLILQIAEADVDDCAATFIFDGPSDAAEPALRKAVAAYLETPEGKAYNDSIDGDFNWGDAMTEIPAEYWAAFGITFNPSVDHAISVDHDEILGRTEGGD